MATATRFLALCLLVLCSLTTGCAQSLSEGQAPTATHGVLDLSRWSLAEHGPVPLAGEWEFYWEQLLEPADFRAGGRAPRPLYELVPDYWTHYAGAYPARGYATYRLRVRLDAPADTLALLLPGQGSAYRLWLNGRLLSSDGRVGRAPDESQPDRSEQLQFFSAETPELELVLQISNFHHRKAGFRNEIVLGPASALQAGQRVEWQVKAFCGGMVLIIAFYHLCLFAYRPQQRSNLYFGLLSLCVAARLWLTEQSLLQSLLPALSWSVALKAEYFTFYFVLVLYTAFMRSLYPREYPRWFLWQMLVIATGFGIATLFLDTYHASMLVPPYQVIYLLNLAALGVMLCLVVVRRRDFWFYTALASIVVAVGNILEILHVQGYLPSGGASAPTFVGFLLVQAAMLSARFSRSFQQVEELSVTLEQRNQRLQESEQKYRSIFENSLDVIFVAGTDSRLETVSPAVKSLLDFTPEELVQGRPLDQLASGDWPRFVAEIEARGSVHDFLSSLKHRDGHRVPVLVNASARRDRRGRFTGYQGVVRNISDRLLAEEQQRRAELLEHLASLDPLTQAYNRGYFQSVSQQELKRAQRSGEPVSLVLLDIDNFKLINDTHGHLVGDDVLVQVAAFLKSQTRKSDTLARYGGEEFVLLLPNTSEESATARAEALRRQIQTQRFEAKPDIVVHITISLGVTGWHPDETLEAILARADHALYESKRRGRNRVTRAT